MSMNNKQRWLGGVVLLGGGVLLAALLLKGKDEIHQNNVNSSALVEQVQQQKHNPQPANTDQVVQLQPLTVDVETEQRLLEEQKRAREKAVAEQEARAAEFLAMQQQAEAEAARKAAEEYAALNAHRSNQQSSDNIPPELVQDEKTKQQRAQEEAKKLQAENKAEADKKAAEEKQLAEQRKAQEAEAKRKAEEAKAEAKRKEEAEQAAQKNEPKPTGQWMVQVALTPEPAQIDAVTAKLRAKGYKITQSPTTKGLRIMVGPAKTRAEADALRRKINADASLGMESAWVIDWVPLNKTN